MTIKFVQNVNIDCGTTTAPISTTSSILCENLNADFLDGLNSSSFMRVDKSTPDGHMQAGTNGGNYHIVFSYAASGNIDHIWYDDAANQFNFVADTTLYATANATVAARNYVSTVATGTAPLTVSSTTAVTNLNADLLDGQHGSYYTNAGNLTGTIPAGVLESSGRYIQQVQFTPVATGWHRLISGSAIFNQGNFYLETNYNNRIDILSFDLISNTYGGVPALHLLYNSYAGGTNISAIRVGNDGVSNFYLDINISSIVSAGTITFRQVAGNYTFPLVASPVSGASTPTGGLREWTIDRGGIYSTALVLGNTTGEVIKLGDNTNNSTATPVSIDMGATRSNEAGRNLKIELYNTGSSTSLYGFGVSAGQLDYRCGQGAAHAFWVETTKVAEIVNTGISLRAAPAFSAATQFLVTTSDPASTTTSVATRTPAQVLSDIGAAAASSIGNGTLTLNVNGTGLSGSASFTANQSGNSTFTVTSNATSSNTASTIVARDGSGNFTAGTITAALAGNANTATTLQTARTINGFSFNGSTDINFIDTYLATNSASAPKQGISLDYSNTTGLGDWATHIVVSKFNTRGFHFGATHGSNTWVGRTYNDSGWSTPVTFYHTGNFNPASYALETHNHTLDSLSNVTITSNNTGEILKWSGSAWINNTLAEAGIQPLDSTLTSLAAYNTNGILTQTATDTFVGRTITGTANQVTVTNGDGVSGNPTLSLPQNIHTGATPTFASLTLTNTTGEVIKLGNNTSTSTATPVSIDMGGTYSNAAGSNLKIELFNNSNSNSLYGFGVSNAQLDYRCGNGADHAFWVNTTKVAEIGSSGVIVQHSAPTMYLNTTTTTGLIGTSNDYPVDIYTNGSPRFRFTNEGTYSSAMRKVSTLRGSTVAVTADNWYRIFSTTTTNAGIGARIRIWGSNTHNCTEIDFVKGTAGNNGWTCKASRRSVYQNSTPYSNITSVRVVDAGTNGVTHIDVKLSATHAGILLYTQLEVDRIDGGDTDFFVNWTSQGTGAAGVELLVNDYIENIATNAAGKSIYTLTNDGVLTLAGNKLNVAHGSSSADTGIEVAPSRSVDGAAYIDFTAATGSPDYSARLIRNSGVNGSLQLSNTGTGWVELHSSSTVALYATSSVETFISSVSKLLVNNNVAVRGGASLVLERVDSTNEGGELVLNRASDNTNGWTIDTYGSGTVPDLRFLANGTSLLARLKTGGEFEAVSAVFGATARKGTEALLVSGGTNSIAPSTGEVVVGNGGIWAANFIISQRSDNLPALSSSCTRTLTAGVSDGLVGSLSLGPTYNGSFTVTRHNYITLSSPGGTSTVTDAAVFQFNAAAGTHKAVDTGTTKAAPGTVNAWMKVNVNGTIHYVPCYTSKT